MWNPNLLMLRRQIARITSKIGTPIATSGTRSAATVTAGREHWSMPVAAKNSPRNMLPVSPMKMRAGEKL